MKISLQEKINRYYNNHPFFEEYRGWVIRTTKTDDKYLGTLTYHTCDVQPGVKSCTATHVELVREWVDEQIKLGLTQKEDI